MRDHVAHYPGGVSGLVLVDSSTPLQEQRFQALAGPNPTRQVIDQANLWYQMQEDLKKLSTRRRRIIAKGSGHYIQGERENLALKETQPFIDQIRGSAPQHESYGSTITK